MTARISREFARLACLAGFVGMLMVADMSSAAIALVPTRTLLPEISSVHNVLFQECHVSCHVENGKKYCTRACSQQTTVTSTKLIQRRTGPTLPPKPVGTRSKNH
jgi:heterodisulfide reductase subunit A-like polyferredoxin